MRIKNKMLFILLNFPIKIYTFPSALCQIFPLNVCAQSAVALCPTSGLCLTLLFKQLEIHFLKSMKLFYEMCPKVRLADP